MPGFIHDKLEIKFLILYITARVIEPIPFDTVWDLAMCDEGVDYFDFAECLSDLVRTEHLTLSADGLYAITDKGLRNSRICESSLPYSVRLRCDKNLAACNRHLRRKSQVKASTEKRPNGHLHGAAGAVGRHGQRDGPAAGHPPGGHGRHADGAVPEIPGAAVWRDHAGPDVLRARGRGPVRRGGEGAPPGPPGPRSTACRPVLGDKEGFSCFRLYGTGCSSRSSPFWPVCCSAGCCAAGGAAGC